MAQKVYVVCVDQERGKHLAWFDAKPSLRAESCVSADEAIGKLMFVAQEESGVPPLEIIDMDMLVGSKK